MKNIDVEAMIQIKACWGQLTHQQYKTLRGQVLAPMIALYAIWLAACIVLGIYTARHKDEDE